MEINKVMWIDSDWELFKKMILGSSINYLWENDIDSNVTFLNSNGDNEAYLLDQFLVNEFMNYYTTAKENGKYIEQKEFLRNKIMEIRNHNNHFYNSTVVPFQREYNLGDIVFRMNENDSSVYIVRMDLLSTDRDDLITGIDRNYLSMGLYYYITNILKKRCILFTEETEKNLINDNWKNIYTNNLGSNLVLKRSTENGK